MVRWDDPDELVINPAKLLRQAKLARSLLEELQAAPLDDAGARRRARHLVRQMLVELGSSLSEEMTAELASLVHLPGEQVPSAEDLRIVQAQIVGWLEGLLSSMDLAVIALAPSGANDGGPD